MAVMLRAFNFIGEHATLSVSECADGSRVLVTMEGGPPQAQSKYSILLEREDWDALVDFDALNEAEEDELPNVTREISFVEEEDQRPVMLEVSQVPERDVVNFIMRRDGDPDPDEFLITELDKAEWHHLISLDLFSRHGGGTPAPRRQDGADGSVH